MHFPKFWAMGRSGPYTCWRSSDVSVADARAKADEGARKIGERIGGGERWRYGYPDRAVREEVLERAPDGAWAVTRNAYGCEVLNTAALVFVDVDKDGDPKPHLARAQAWADRHAGWGFRVYRTKAGLRLLATHAPIAPDSPVIVSDLFPAMGTDPLYARLCKTQGSFRARLTPKPWRCGVAAPHLRWPWADASVEDRFKQWSARYQEKAAKYATCELVAELGERAVRADFAPVIQMHDRATRVGSGLPLA